MTKPAENKNFPAVAPTGPNMGSILFFVAIKSDLIYSSMVVNLALWRQFK
jgi:hypothetical protein